MASEKGLQLVVIMPITAYELEECGSPLSRTSTSVARSQNCHDTVFVFKSKIAQRIAVEQNIAIK